MKGRRIAYEVLAEVLRAAGWDVTIYDTVEGQLSPAHGPGVWTISINHSGQVLFRATWAACVPQGERWEREGRLYRVLREETCTFTATTEIDSAEDVLVVLEEVTARIQVSSQ